MSHKFGIKGNFFCNLHQYGVIFMDVFVETVLLLSTDIKLKQEMVKKRENYAATFHKWHKHKQQPSADPKQTNPSADRLDALHPSTPSTNT